MYTHKNELIFWYSVTDKRQYFVCRLITWKCIFVTLV